MAVTLACAWASPALAAEPRLPAEPRTMQEPGEHVLVADAFDEGDLFDLNVGLDYELSERRASVHRRDAGGATREVASFERSVSRLTPRLEVGLYRELAMVIRLPLVLSDSRALRSPEGSPGVVPGAPGEAMLRFPFRAAERSGLEHLSVGLDAAPLSAVRGTGPFELRVGGELRFAVGDPMRACRQDAPEAEVSCAHPGDVDRDGRRDPGEPDARGPVDAGITRGTLGLVLHAAASKRIAALEPFLRSSVLVELPTSSIWDAPTGGAGPARPPVQIDAALGLAFVPWENRERFSRFTVDGHAELELRTRGRDFAELFDALGTSSAPSLRQAVERSGVRAYATGLELVEEHARIGLGTSVTWQPSRLVKIGAGLRLAWDTPHGITDEEPCGDDACADSSPTNPAYREVLHGDAERFSVESALTVAFGARGVVMF